MQVDPYHTPSITAKAPPKNKSKHQQEKKKVPLESTAYNIWQNKVNIEKVAQSNTHV